MDGNAHLSSGSLHAQLLAGNHTLADAAVDGDLDLVISVVTKHPEKVNDIDVEGGMGMAALHYAAERGHVEIAEYLLEHGADINQQSRSGRNSLYIEGATALSLACKHDDNFPMVEMLLLAGADPTIATDGGFTPLMRASQSPNSTTIVKLLLNHRQGKTTVNYQCNQLGTALNLACDQGHVESVRILLEAGADIHLGKSDGTTPLAVAMAKHHSEIVKLLQVWRAFIDCHRHALSVLFAGI